MNQRYDKSFKEEAIRLALTKGESIAQTAKNLGIKEATLYSWISQAKKVDTAIPDGNNSLSAEKMIGELNRLRKENARLKEEREILKKATAFFVKEEGKR